MAYVPINIDESVRKECKRRKYSDKTIKTYLYCINRFLIWCKKDIGKISKKDVREFLFYLSNKNLAGNTLNTYHMAIRFLFEDILDKRIWIDIKYSKTPKKLPVVLSKDEVKALFEVIDNKKHLLMIELMYGAGLRVSELTNLRVEDLSIDKGFGFVRHGKGGKDRIFILPGRLKGKIWTLINEQKLKTGDFLFKTNRNGKYSIRSLQQILKKASKKAKLGRMISPHTLRHSFATHLLENGCDVSSVQALLGHKSPETTFTYLHIASPNMINVKSPIDSL